MAGDWIPMRCDLADDPAVIAISAETSLDIDSVVGKLHRLWAWANRQLRDGNARGVTEKWIDAKVACNGFAKAMQISGWLTITAKGVRFPEFDAWNSQGAKKRQLTAQRVANHKAKKGNAASVSGALPKEEKRREESKSNTPLPPKGGGTARKRSPQVDAKSVQIPESLAVPEFTAAWNLWVDEKLNRKQKLTEQGWREQLAKLAEHGPHIAAQAIRQSIANGWRGLFPEKIPRTGGNGSGVDLFAGLKSFAERNAE